MIFSGAAPAGAEQDILGRVSNDELLRRHESAGRERCAGAAAGLASAPALHTAVLTCMDCRIDEQALFGLEPGDVHVLRNAGGVVTDDVVRSLAISQRKLGTREVLARETGLSPSWRPQAFDDAATNVRRGVARLRSDPFLLDGTGVRGFVLDIETFTLTEVPPA